MACSSSVFWVFIWVLEPQIPATAAAATAAAEALPSAALKSSSSNNTNSSTSNKNSSSSNSSMGSRSILIVSSNTNNSTLENRAKKSSIPFKLMERKHTRICDCLYSVSSSPTEGNSESKGISRDMKSRERRMHAENAKSPQIEEERDTASDRSLTPPKARGPSTSKEVGNSLNLPGGPPSNSAWGPPPSSPLWVVEPTEASEAHRGAIKEQTFSLFNLIKHQQQQQQQQQKGQQQQQQQQQQDGGVVSADLLRQQNAIVVKGLADPPLPFVKFGDQLSHDEETAATATAAAAAAAGGAAAAARATTAPLKGLPAWLLKRLEQLGYQRPTAIQMQVRAAAAATAAAATATAAAAIAAATIAAATATTRTVETVLAPAAATTAAAATIAAAAATAAGRGTPTAAAIAAAATTTAAATVAAAAATAATVEAAVKLTAAVTAATVAAAAAVTAATVAAASAATATAAAAAAAATAAATAAGAVALLSRSCNDGFSSCCCSVESTPCSSTSICCCCCCCSVNDQTVCPLGPSRHSYVGVYVHLGRLLLLLLLLFCCAEGTGFRAAFPQAHAGSCYGAADAVFATPLSLLTLLKEKRGLESDFVAGRASAAAPDIEQELVFCSTEAGKLWALKNLRIERRLTPPCLIFVETQERASELLAEMLGEGLAVDALHASKSKRERDRTVEAFRTGKTWFLISTDLVARGVDFKGVSLVINFDLPLSTAVYIHRIGRTGRAGRRGQALTFFTLEDVPRLRPIIQVMQRSPNSKIPEFIRGRLTRNLKVKGRKPLKTSHHHQQQQQQKQHQQQERLKRRPTRRPIRPVARVDVLMVQRHRVEGKETRLGDRGVPREEEEAAADRSSSSSIQQHQQLQQQQHQQEEERQESVWGSRRRDSS
ncbi:hypothetical protein Emag_007361 [Eimeria magna]